MKVGYNIIQDARLTKVEWRTVNRTWRERLLSWPWRPWKKTRIERVYVPDPNLYVITPGVVVCHPAMAGQLLESIEPRPLVPDPGDFGP